MITPRAKRDRAFYVALTFSISATAFAGFSFTYFGPILGGTYPRTGFPLHLHGWSFFLWYLLFPLQALLIARRSRKLHEILGRVSVLLVTLMTLTGILVLAVRVEEAVRTGQPQVWLLYGPLILTNLILFVVFYGVALRMALTRRLEAHRRLIVVASSIALGAGLFRLILFLSGFHPLSLPIGVLACSVFVLAAMAYDWITRRLVHRAYLIGFIAMITVQGLLLPQVNAGLVASINEGLAVAGEHLGVLYDPEPTVEF